MFDHTFVLQDVREVHCILVIKHVSPLCFL